MLDTFTFPDAIGVVGSLLICGAYFAVSTGRMETQRILYQVMNASGAFFLLISLWYRPNPGAILIEGIWLIIAGTSLIRMWLKRRSV